MYIMTIFNCHYIHHLVDYAQSFLYNDTNKYHQYRLSWMLLNMEMLS